MPTSLSDRALESLPLAIDRPTYDRTKLRAGIVHFGVGNFHRSHQGDYLDRLFSAGVDHDWAILGAGVIPGDERMRGVLESQDYLSLLVTRSADTTLARVIGPMIGFLPIGDEAAIVAKLTDPAIRIVSLTLTEGGYFLGDGGAFDAGHPAIRADAASPDTPRTVFGMMLKALSLRRAAGTAPFTIMTCDNIPHNGSVTRATMTGLASLFDADFSAWVGAQVSFPNSMVDRITPVTSDAERLFALSEYGIVDGWPVFAEDFKQWVLEDDFPLGRPALERVGVTFVEDVTPYEEMKLRVLNASHAIIAYPAALLGIDYAHDAIRHPPIAALLERIQRDEIMPAVASVPEMTPARYFDIVRTRFANPNIADTVARLCYDGANRQPKFIVPAIRAAIERKLPITGLALSSALWCRYCAGTRDDGSPIASGDPAWARLNEVAHRARGNPRAWLDQREIYGDLGEDERFRNAFWTALERLFDGGVKETLAAMAAYPG